MSAARAFVLQLDELAVDVGRLRRRFASNPGWTGVYVADRIAERVQTLDAIIRPTAAEIFQANRVCGADEAEAIAEALADTERRTTDLRRMVGDATDGQLERGARQYRTVGFA